MAVNNGIDCLLVYNEYNTFVLVEVLTTISRNTKYTRRFSLFSLAEYFATLMIGLVFNHLARYEF